MKVGIDIGSTTTKAVSLDNDKILCRLKTKAIDPITSATGIIGKLTLENDIAIHDIDKIMITGVGACRIHKDIFNIPTKTVDEVTSIGWGGMFLTKKEKMIIANIGTGTIFIEAARDKITHIGGSGVGGGTIVGLSKAMLGTREFDNIMNLAEKGDIKKVDLLLGDIMDSSISFLHNDDVAANFGKMLDTSKDEDVAIGLINMVYQVVGMLSVFAARGQGYNTVLVTGNGSNNHLGQKVFNRISEMYNIKFEYPEDAEYTTAIGAALCG